MEKIYIGTKIIAAEEMTEREFATLMKRPSSVGYADRLGYKVRYEDGYVSWSPKETFERAYRLITEAEKGLIHGG